MPSPERRTTKNRFSPSATAAGVSGLAGGITDAVRAAGKPIWFDERGSASASRFGSGGACSGSPGGGLMPASPPAAHAVDKVAARIAGPKLTCNASNKPSLTPAVSGTARNRRNVRLRGRQMAATRQPNDSLARFRASKRGAWSDKAGAAAFHREHRAYSKVLMAHRH